MTDKNWVKRIDWVTTIVPFVIVLCLMAVFMLFPEHSKTTVDSWRAFFGDTIGLYYSFIGIGCVLTALYWAFSSKYGKTVLGDERKPLYSNFKWGTMIFTSTMAGFPTKELLTPSEKSDVSVPSSSSYKSPLIVTPSLLSVNENTAASPAFCAGSVRVDRPAPDRGSRAVL